MFEDIVSAAERLIAERARPIVIALDGPSGAGKSTLASQLATKLPATVVPSDDFFAAEITAAEWDARSLAERTRDAIDWRRLRRTVLEPLRAGKHATWHPFDFAAGERTDGTYPMSTETVQRAPAPVIIVEGAYSTRPELADLIDLAILVDAPLSVRHERQAARDSPAFLEAWHRRWDAAEELYFTQIRPSTHFDFVINSVTEASLRRESP